MSAFSIPADYGYVIASIGVCAIFQTAAGFAVMGARTKHFKNNEKLWAKPTVKAYVEEQKKANGATVDKLGYPDMGNGLLAQQLEFSEWADFNNIQRTHYKWVEESGPFLACMLGSGLIYPKTIAVLGVLNSVGRVLWAVGYSKGSQKRFNYGGPLVPLTYVAVLFTTVYAGLTKAGAIAAITTAANAFLGGK